MPPTRPAHASCSSSRTARGPKTMVMHSDSLRFDLSADVQKDPIALRALATHTLQRGRINRGGTSYAEVAIPDKGGNVLLFASSLRDTLANDSLVRSRLLWAGFAGLAIAVLAGFGASEAFARRIRRLEQAAERIAGGRLQRAGRRPAARRARPTRGRVRPDAAPAGPARRRRGAAFIANASHELRTPIFSLGGFLELLQDEDLDEETQREFLATMTEQVQRLSKLATDLLDLSRLDAGRMRLELEPVPLAEAAQRSRRRVRRGGAPGGAPAGGGRRARRRRPRRS